MFSSSSWAASDEHARRVQEHMLSSNINSNSSKQYSEVTSDKREQVELHSCDVQMTLTHTAADKRWGKQITTQDRNSCRAKDITNEIQ